VHCLIAASSESTVEKLQKRECDSLVAVLYAHPVTVKQVLCIEAVVQYMLKASSSTLPLCIITEHCVHNIMSTVTAAAAMLCVQRWP
jgi:hypothetical protein